MVQSFFMWTTKTDEIARSKKFFVFFILSFVPTGTIAATNIVRFFFQDNVLVDMITIEEASLKFMFDNAPQMIRGSSVCKTRLSVIPAYSLNIHIP